MEQDKKRHEQYLQGQRELAQIDSNYIRFCYKVAKANNCESFTYRPCMTLFNEALLAVVKVLMRSFPNRVYGVAYRSEYEQSNGYDQGKCVLLKEPRPCRVYVVSII